MSLERGSLPLSASSSRSDNLEIVRAHKDEVVAILRNTSELSQLDEVIVDKVPSIYQDLSRRVQRFQ